MKILGEMYYHLFTVMQLYLGSVQYFIIICFSVLFANYSTYTGCPRRKGPNFGRVFLRSNYTDVTQNTYI
jgi:hypothetical protein